MLASALDSCRKPREPINSKLRSNSVAMKEDRCIGIM